MKVNHLLALSETGTFDFRHGFSTAESRRIVDRRTGRYLLDPEYGVAMVEDLATQWKCRCPQGCGRHSNFGHVELKISTDNYYHLHDRSVAMTES